MPTLALESFCSMSVRASRVLTSPLFPGPLRQPDDDKVNTTQYIKQSEAQDFKGGMRLVKVKVPLLEVGGLIEVLPGPRGGCQK